MRLLRVDCLPKKCILALALGVLCEPESGSIWIVPTSIPISSASRMRALAACGRDPLGCISQGFCCISRDTQSLVLTRMGRIIRAGRT